MDQLREANGAIGANAEQVTAVANSLAASSEQGFSLSENVQRHTENLSAELSQSTRQIAELLEESKRITDIVTIMSDISATTNVLSINASIVAARAGTKGREFAVVAKEVRKLSVDTDSSLRNIAELVTSIQERIKDLSARLESVSSDIRKENESMLAVGGTLQGISLAAEVVRSVTSVSGDRARESASNLLSAEKLLTRSGASRGETDGQDLLTSFRNRIDAARSASD